MVGVEELSWSWKALLGPGHGQGCSPQAARQWGAGGASLWPLETGRGVEAARWLLFPRVWSLL